MEKNSNERLMSSRRNWFVALIAYYVFVLYLVPSTAKVERFSLTYFALVIPAWLFIVINWKYLLTGYGLASRLLAVFAIASGLIGVFRWDIPLAYNALFLAGMAIVILNSGAYIKLEELNLIFLGTVMGSMAVYAFGLTEYGFLLGQADAPGCHAKMNWRVSLFRVTAESAMLSLVVLVANMAYGNHLRWWLRSFICFTAAYFLIFSGIRSIVAPSFIVVLACALIVFKRFNVEARRGALLFALVSSFVIASLPNWLLGQQDDFWEHYFLRTSSCDYISFTQEMKLRSQAAGKTQSDNATIQLPQDELSNEEKKEWILSTINRQCAARYALSLFTAHPLGSSDVQPKSAEDLAKLGGWCPSGQLIRFCASCVFPTYWLSRAGIAAIPLLLCFGVLLVQAIRGGQTILSWVFIAFGVTMLAWGVMFVPYNVTFLLMMAMPAIIAACERRSGQT